MEKKRILLVEDEKDLATGRELGADAYIIKPFDSKALLAKIKELIGG